MAMLSQTDATIAVNSWFTKDTLACGTKNLGSFHYETPKPPEPKPIERCPRPRSKHAGGWCKSPRRK